MPTILLPIKNHPQHSTGDCLAACAAMALDYAGVSIAYNRLLRLLDVQSYGTPGSRLNRLTALDVNVRYAYGTTNLLVDALTDKHPCIVLLRTGYLPYWTYATDHAILVIGFDEHNFYVNDPAFEQAPYQVSRSDLELAWMEFDYRYALIWR